MLCVEVNEMAFSHHMGEDGRFKEVREQAQRLRRERIEREREREKQQKDLSERQHLQLFS